MIADALDIEEKDVLRTVNEYTDALILLDQYDHQALSKSEGSTPVYRIHSMRRDTSSKYSFCGTGDLEVFYYNKKC